MPWRAAITGRALHGAWPGGVRGLRAACARGGQGPTPLPSPPALPGHALRGVRLAAEPPLRLDDAAERVLGRHGRWLLAVAREAHAEAGLHAWPREQVGLCVALGMVDPDAEDLAAAVAASRAGDGSLSLERFHAGGFRAMHPLWPLSMLGNVAAGQVAIDLDLRGDNTVLASDGSAGVRVLLEARRALQAGAAGAVLAAAASEPLTPARAARLALAGPAAAWCEPGEGAAALVLEPEASAAARGARVAGWLVGAAACHGLEGEPASALLGRAVQGALSEAGWQPGEAGHVVRVGSVSAASLGRLGLHAPATAPGEAVGDLLGAAPLLATALAVECGAPRVLVVHAEGSRAAGALAVEVAA